MRDFDLDYKSYLENYTGNTSEDVDIYNSMFNGWFFSSLSADNHNRVFYMINGRSIYGFKILKLK